MAKTTDFTNFSTEHPNYFAGQYLLESDFEIQHKYLSDRQKYQNQSLHVSGIIEGLEIEAIAGKTEVIIRPGSAINSNGELIILKEDTTFSLPANVPNGELYIQYSEEPQSPQQQNVADSYTRWIEKHIVGFATTIPANIIAKSVKLAKLTISGDTITDLDTSVREYSGLSLPNSNSKALTLRSGGNANPNLAVLTGSLKIDADLIVTGIISGKIDAINVTSGVLAVERIPNLPANKITPGTVTGNLTVTGNFTINTGGVGSWNKLVVTNTSEWGDGSNQYVTIGAGGADGIMLSNPHVTWRDKRASIRYGRTGGIQAGSFWDAGVRQDGSFSFSLDGVDDHKLTIAKNGTISIKGATQPSAGSTENNGILFPKDPGGGSGDAAWIRYYSRNPNSPDAGTKEQLTLEIGTSNDPQDHIALMPSGGVGIGTYDPGAKLEVKGGQTKLEQEAWQTPTFQNGWVNYDNVYNSAGYFKDSLGIVHLRGLVRNGTSNTTIFILPAGYRPSNRELLTVQTYTTATGTANNTTGRVDILTDGQVLIVFGSNGWLSLDGLTFRSA
jgi:hypothetical protein